MWDDHHPSPDVVNSSTASFILIFIIGVVGQWDMSSRESHQYLDNVQRCSSALSHYRNLQFHVYCLSMIYIVAGVRMPKPRTGPHKIPGICPTLMSYILCAIYLSRMNIQLQEAALCRQIQSEPKFPFISCIHSVSFKLDLRLYHLGNICCFIVGSVVSQIDFTLKHLDVVVGDIQICS